MATVSECIASAAAAASQLGELVRREWPARGNRRVDAAIRAHVMTLLDAVASLPPEQHLEAIGGIIQTLLHTCVACQEELLARSALGRQGL